MAQRTTKSQVSGYRFLLRRLEHALVRRDVRMIHDPMSGHVKALVVGLVLTLVVLGGAVALSFFKPQGSVGDSKVLISKQSGQLYVLLGDQLHPALNLASARLAAGVDENPNSVSDKILSKYTRGPQLGIAGAPSSLAAKGAPGRSIWTVCDRLDEPRNPDGRPTVGVVAGPPTGSSTTRGIGPDDAMLVRNGEDAYLIYRNTRAAIDPADSAVRQTFGLQDASARSVSNAVLDAIPPSRPIVAPTIADAGRPSSFTLNGARIGSIVTATSLDNSGGTTSKLYVVLKDGVQQISPLVGDLIRAKQAISDRPIEVPLNALTTVPTVDELAVSGYPDTAPRLVDGTADKALCLGWTKNDDAAASIGLSLGPDFPVADPTSMVPTVGAAGDGLSADVAYIPPGSGYFVRTTGVDANSTRSASDFLVTDTGVRYGVPASSAGPLGMPDPLAAPYAIVALLPPGPTLAQNAALTARDDLAPTGGS
ncbi:type VII secretion protein EccB [Williamsia herbipolensis]|uniref:Type VII secretion protein EccB n=1 Tax=Williamsia herbipolensis TaxID=1603258 RepID=A0AAU4K0E8_9NOCA|nr:type VII secretion protein EccB [Williamsia herbipolensis]